MAQTAVSLSWQDWLATQKSVRTVPLFDCEESNPLQVKTRFSGREGTGRWLLLRHPEMEQAIIEEVEAGLATKSWSGLLFIMGYGEINAFSPVHLSCTEREGRKHPISNNIQDIRRNKNMFARWGDKPNYVIGDLSDALFLGTGGPNINAYLKWAKFLFSSSEPPLLKRPVQLLVLPWHKGQHGPSRKPQDVLSELKRELLSMISSQPNQLISKS